MATQQDQPKTTDSDRLPPKMDKSLEKPRTSPSGDDDLPVLTEIIAVKKDKPAPSVKKPSASPSVTETDINELAALMTKAIEQKVAYELPTLIEATLLDIVADLRGGIASTVDAALREFITNHNLKNEDPDQ